MGSAVASLRPLFISPPIHFFPRPFDPVRPAHQEWFYQVKGDMKLYVVEPNGNFGCIDVREGDIYLLPGGCRLGTAAGLVPNLVLRAWSRGLLIASCAL